MIAPGRRADVGGVSVPVDHLIGGAWVGSHDSFETRSPLAWDDGPLAEVARGDDETARAAVVAARRGFDEWSAFTVEQRAAVLYRLADLIEARADDIATVETLDMAFLQESMRQRLVSRGALNFRTYADLIVAHDERRWDAKSMDNVVQRMPAGPAVVITPWNAPFMLSTWKLAPALAAGNSVIHKPAEWSPLTAALLAELTLDAGFPPGAYNLVQGIGEEVGAALVADPGVRRITFTGSPATARHIGKAAAENIVPFTAELGGKGPLLVSSPTAISTRPRIAQHGSSTTRARCASPAPACSSTSRSATSSSRSSTITRTHSSSATAATRRPRSRRWCTPTTAPPCTASSSGRERRVTRSCAAASRSMAVCTTSRR